MTANAIGAAPARPRLPRLSGLAWVTWRQHRTALILITGSLVAVGAFLTVQGLAMHAAYRSLGQAPPEVFQNRYGAWPDRIAIGLMFLPVFFGVFLGGPLVARERDLGTYRFAWTLGRSRVRWLIAKLLLLGGSLAVLAEACSLVCAWWYTPWVPLRGRIGADMYQVMGPVFAARTLFCFALGVALGSVLRRTVPALAAGTLAGLAAIVVPQFWLVPRIQQPVAVDVDLDPGPATGMTVNQWVVDPAGHRLTSAQTDSLDVQAGPDMVNRHLSFHRWLTEHHYSSWVSYQPDSRFWHFQTVETAGYLTGALLLAGLAVWWIRRPIH